jgi:hypothetical protein
MGHRLARFQCGQAGRIAAILALDHSDRICCRDPRALGLPIFAKVGCLRRIMAQCERLFLQTFDETPNIRFAALNVSRASSAGVRRLFINRPNKKRG